MTSSYPSYYESYMAQPPPPAPNISSLGLWSDPSPLNLFPFIVTPIRSTDPKGGGWMSTEAIVTTPELYSIKSFTRTIIQSPTRGNGGGYNIEYGGWNFSFILKKVPPFPGFHLHVQNPSLPSAVRVVTVNATAVAGHSLSEVEGWCNGASVRMECVDDSSNIYTHVKNATKKQIQPQSQSVAHPVEFGGGWVPPPPKEASSFTGIRSYDQGNRLPLTISTMLKKIRPVQTKRSESEKNKEEAISMANRIMVEYNMSQRDFVDLVIEVEGGDKDDVINFMNFGDGSSEEVYKLCCRLRTWIQSSGPTSPQHSNNNSSRKGCGKGLGVGVKVVSASKTSTSVVKAASPVARRGAPAPCGNCGEHGHSQLKCTKIGRVFSGGGYQEGQAKGSRKPSPKKKDGSFNLDNDDDSDASMFEDDEDLFDLEEVKRKIGAQRMDAKLNYGFPEDWDVYILKSSKDRRGSQRSNQQCNVVINYFIETPIGRQFRSLEKAKKYLQSLKRTIRPTRAKSSKSLKVDRTALTADRGSDFNPAADKARFSAIAAPAANATTTSKSRKMTKLVEKLSVGSNIRHKSLGHGVIIKISRSWLRGDFGGKKDQPFRITDLSSIQGVAIEEIEKELPAKKQKRVIPTKTDDAVSLARSISSLIAVGTNVRHPTHGDGVVTNIKGAGWLIGEFDGEKVSFRSTKLELIEGVALHLASPPSSQTDDAVSLAGPSKNTHLLFVGTNVRHKTHGDGVVTIAKGKGWMIGEFDGEEITFRSTELELIEGVPVSSPPTSPAFKNTPKTALKKTPKPTPKQTCEPYNTPLSPKEISEGWEYIDPVGVGVPRTWRVKRIFYNNPVKTSFVIEARPSGKIFKSGKGARDYLKNINVGVDGKAAPHKCAKHISRPMDFEGGLKRKVFIEKNPTSFGLSSKWRVVERYNGNKAKFYLSPEGCYFESQRTVQSYIEEMGGLDKIDKLELPLWIPPNTPASPPTPSNLDDSISASTPPDPSSSSKADWTVSERMKDSELEKSKQCLSQNTAASNSPRPPRPAASSTAKTKHPTVITAPAPKFQPNQRVKVHFDSGPNQKYSAYIVSRDLFQRQGSNLVVWIYKIKYESGLKQEQENIPERNLIDATKKPPNSQMLTGTSQRSSTPPVEAGCICGDLHPAGTAFWLCCDGGCNVWYHVGADCVGFTEQKASLPEFSWSCDKCKRSDRTKAIKRNVEELQLPTAETPQSSSNSSSTSGLHSPPALVRGPSLKKAKSTPSQPLQAELLSALTDATRLTLMGGTQEQAEQQHQQQQQTAPSIDATRLTLTAEQQQEQEQDQLPQAPPEFDFTQQLMDVLAGSESPELL